MRSSAEFDAIEKQLRRKGFWILFNPSLNENFRRVKVGHFSLLVDGTLFSRSFRDGTPRAAMTLPWERRAEDVDIQVGLNTFLAAQFFEANPETIQLLKQFSTERVRDLVGGQSDSSFTYKFRPYSRDRNEPRVENCATFCFNWAHPAFLEANPQLADIGKAMGTVNVAEMPNVQLGYNTSAPGNRATLIISASASETEKRLKSTEIRTDPFLHQLLIDEPLDTIHR
jgi:hypothetical protein